MNLAFAQLEQLIETYAPLLNELTREKASIKLTPDKWSKKEIIGHLIDSAHNNLRRFIVAQHEDRPFIVYAQDHWVKASNYQGWPLKDIITLWVLLNRQIVSVLKNIPPEKYNCEVQTQEIHTIDWLAEDYNKHLLHHLHVALEMEEVEYP